jgi:hypothetical protein
VVLLQGNVGFWPCGRIGKGQLILYNYFTLVVGCGLVGGSQIVGQKDTFYIGCGNVAKQCGLPGLWADWKGTVNFVIVSFWLWAVDLWANLK